MGKLGIVRLFAWVTRGSAHGADVTVDPGGGANVTAENFQPSGVHSRPLTGDYVALVSGPGTGREIAIGYVDPLNDLELGPGDLLVYSRDPSTGQLAAKVLLEADGSITVANSNGSITLNASGEIDLNGVTITPAGDITTSGSIAAPSIVAAGLELAGHVHAVTTAPGTTGPNQ